MKNTSRSTIVQAMIDKSLKDDVEKILLEIGVDVPTAIRMCFRGIVRENGLPEWMTHTGAAAAPEEAPEEAEPEEADAPVIEKLPLLDGNTLDPRMFTGAVKLVPFGRITRVKDIERFMSRIYDRDIEIYDFNPEPGSDEENVPYWKIVSDRGYLEETLHHSITLQEHHLLQEGIPVGHLAKDSSRVLNYREYLFDFTRVQVV